MSERRRLVGINLDWSNYKGPNLERRLEQWGEYQAGVEWPGVDAFERLIDRLIAAGKVEVIEPGVVAKVSSFSKAVARDVRTGRRRVPRPVRTRRMEECRACELYNLRKGTCKACGCVMTRKTHWSNVECPIGRWGIYEGEKNE